MSLSSLIVQREIATIRDVEEALARQVLYGGDLVTNLLEVCRVDESALNLVVADAMGLPAAPGGELPLVPTEAKKLIAPEVAHDRAFAPLSIDQYGITVAVAEPLSADAIQELGFSIGLPIAQQIAPLVRIREAIARDYGIPLDRRTTRVLAKIRGDIPRGVPSMRPPSVAAPPPPKPPSIAPPPPVKVASAPPPRRPSGTFVRDVELPPARPTRRRRGPLTIDVAKKELEDVDERDTILDLVFEFARQYFDYTALFIVKEELAEGRDAFGEGAARERVARLGVPLDRPSILQRSRESKAMVRGKLGEGVDTILASDLARPNGTELVVLPIVVRTRVVAMLLCDAGEGIDEASLSDVRKIVAAAAAAFERLIVRRKLQGTWPPPGVGPGGSVPPPPKLPSDPPPPTKLSPEELAPPVRELNEAMSAPPSPPQETTKQPVAAVRAAAEDDRRRPITDLPPPANLLEVRKPSRVPIPREEPISTPSMKAVSVPSTQVSPEPKRRSSSSGLRRAEAPPLDFAPKPPASMLGDQPFAENDDEKVLLDQIHGAPSTTRDPEPPPVRPVSRTEVSPGNLPMFPDPTASPQPKPVFVDDLTRPAPAVAPVFERSMPPSEQQVSHAPHKPPSSHNIDRVLPSVIVDVSSEYIAFVDRVIKGNDDDAESELLRAGGYAMPAIISKFPGPITLESSRIDDGLLPRAGECGPVLRLVSSQRRTALPFVLALVEDNDPQKRFWATYLLTELVYADAIEPALRRLFDDEARVRRAARAAIRALAEAHPQAIVDRLEALAKDATTTVMRRARAAEALGDSREVLAVPAAIRLLVDAPKEVASAAHASLVLLARQDFGADAEKWRAWWSKNEGRSRIEWLVDALTLDEATVRGAAGDELKAITKESFGFNEDLPKRERERIQAKYREWWTQTGRVRFARQR